MQPESQPPQRLFCREVPITGVVQRVLQLRHGNPSIVCLTLDGVQILSFEPISASCHADDAIWTSSIGSPRTKKLAPRSCIRHGVISPDQTKLYFVDINRACIQCVVLPLMKSLVSSAALAAAFVGCIAISPDGSTLAYGSVTGPVILMDAATLQPKDAYNLAASSTTSIVFTADSNFLVCARDCGICSLLDLRERKMVWKIQTALSTCSCADISPCGTMIALGGGATVKTASQPRNGEEERVGHVLLLDLAEGAPLSYFLPGPSPVTDLAFHGTNHLIVCDVCSGGVFDLTTTRRVRALEECGCQRLSLSLDGTQLLAARAGRCLVFVHRLQHL